MRQYSGHAGRFEIHKKAQKHVSSYIYAAFCNPAFQLKYFSFTAQQAKIFNQINVDVQAGLDLGAPVPKAVK